MLRKIVTYVNLLVMALVAGSVFGIWLGYNPATLSPAAYVEQQQQAIRALNFLMPVLGLFGTLLTVLWAILARSERPVLFMLISAVVCFIASGLITRFGNQPINAVVMTFDPQMPPANLMHFRDTWWNWHIARTVTSVIGLCFLLMANALEGRKN